MTKKRLRGSPKPSFPNLDRALQQITRLGQTGNLTEAAAQCQQLAEQYPENGQVWYLFSLVCLQQGQAELALAHIQRSIDLIPDRADFHSQAGVIFCHLGNLDAGIACYRRALSLQPLAHTRFNLGLALQKQGDLDAAEQVYLELLTDQPNYAAAHQHLGNLYQQRQQFPIAITHYQQAIQHQPQMAEAWCNLGVALQAIGETQQAIQSYQQALEIHPNYGEAHNGLGAAYEKQELATQAIQSYQQALVFQPTYLPALTNLGNIQLRLEQFSAAEATYQQILQLQPNNVPILDNYVKLRLTTCNWSNLSDWIDTLQQSVQAELRQDSPVTFSPLNSLFLPYSAMEQQAIAQNYAQGIDRRMAGLRQQLHQEQTHRSAGGQSNRRIRLGYVSGDFRYHAVGQLILRLFELHDRQSFQIFAYSFSPDDGSLERQKLIQDCDCFRDLQNCTPLEAARQVMQDEIDILIDLAGYTNYACPELLALRPAPLQINYLGYPGTLGADYIDYVITDAVITPAELTATLTETCLYLPETYQINCYPYPGEDTPQLDAAATAQLKQQNGLPANAFVFCCFNKSQKIEPTLFAVWMRILRRVPNSVLWLLSDRPEVEQNLRASAVAQDIAPERLIFATRTSKANHLKRHQCADLFLDTLYYNAHVTASDALWAGTPLITVLGNTFASRVAASLLTAAGLPELIGSDLAEYERQAIHFATHPAVLKQLQDRLIQQRSQSSLFNTARTVQHLEAGYRQIWQRYQTGLKTIPVVVEAIEAVKAVETGIKRVDPPHTYDLFKSNRDEVHSSPPPQFDSAASPIPHLPDETITCTADSGFLNWLSRSNGSLMITTYQAGKVLLVGWNGQQVTLLARPFSKPMGLAMAGDRLALSTQHELLFFANARSLAYNYLEDRPGRYDALYLPRSTYFTGDLHTHDLAFGLDGLWLVNTRFSCLANLSLDGNFLPRWYPSFISKIVPEDRCHLNGLAMVDGKPKYVTALGESDRVGGWRTDKATGGILIEVETDEIVLRGLSMPHSPRWYQGKLWLLNSGTGELWCIDPSTWNHEVVCALPGFGRGLTLVGNYALIGLCQIRERHIFGGLPIQDRFDRLICGVAIVDLQRGQSIGLLEFPTGCRELYDVKFLPGLLRPTLLAPDQAAVREAFTTPEFAYWLRPSAVISEDEAPE